MDSTVAQYGGSYDRCSYRKNSSSDIKQGNVLECGILISLRCLLLAHSGR